MKPRSLIDRVYAVGAVDWDRRLFDALIPLPDGTSYNAYYVQGSEKTALLDSVDPAKAGVLMGYLDRLPPVDIIVAHHAEQDHSGTLPALLARFPQAKLVCSPKAKGLLIDHLGLPEDRITTVEDGATLSLGDKTLEFIHTPWVHWPETMCTYLRENKILFSCDFFGSHLAQSGLFVDDEEKLYESAKRYFAEIMMPFRTAIQKNLDRLRDIPIDMIAPSHGPVHKRPQTILLAYRDWVKDTPKNGVAIAYVSMHGSTETMVERLVEGLDARGVSACRFNMADADIGQLAVRLVDAATIVLAGPAVHVGLHPRLAFAAILANALRPKAKLAAFIGSYGWGQKMVEQLTGFLPNLKVEMLPPILFKGRPREEDLKAVDALAETIAAKHKEWGLF
ncbi:MAG: FprA family A-type flavoprotein [Candidatus Aminicenantes bacterium]|nr:FprA family A-type flavoprotein [Candidatus Aminicenantes bacterium]